MRHLLICFALLGLAFAPAEAVNGRLSIRLHIDAAEAAIPVLSASTMRPRAPRGSSALFVSSLATNLDSADFRRAATSLGPQVDLRLTALSSVDLTLSFGAATVLEEGYDARRAWMASLTLLH